MADQGVAADLAQGDGQELPLQLDGPGLHPGLPHLAHELPGGAQLLLGQGVVLVEDLVELLPEGFHRLRVLRGEGTEAGVGIELAELIDMVALAGVPPAGKGDEVLRPVEVVLPQPVVVHGGVGVALHQVLPLLRGHHAEGGSDPLLQAPAVDLVQGGVDVPLPRQGHRVVEEVAGVFGVVEDHQTAIGLGEHRMPVGPPHELDPHGVLAQAVGAAAVVLAQPCRAFHLDRFKIQHTGIAFTSLSLKFKKVQALF